MPRWPQSTRPMCDAIIDIPDKPNYKARCLHTASYTNGNENRCTQHARERLWGAPNSFVLLRGYEKI